jgi:hypothetical protein
MAAITCPVGASGAPASCTCISGYSGAPLTFDAAGRVWVGTCTPVACPANAAGAPTCTCNSGFNGVPAFSTVSQSYTSGCSRKSLYFLALTLSCFMPGQRCWGPSMCMQLWLQRSSLVQHGHSGVGRNLLMYIFLLLSVNCSGCMPP